MEEEKKSMSEFAIASLVIGGISLISLVGMEKAIAAIVFGALALKRMDRDKRLSGRNVAFAGIALGVCSIIITTFFIIKLYPKIRQQVIQMQEQYKEDTAGGSRQSELIPIPR